MTKFSLKNPYLIDVEDYEFGLTSFGLDHIDRKCIITIQFSMERMLDENDQTGIDSQFKEQICRIPSIAFLDDEQLTADRVRVVWQHNDDHNMFMGLIRILF